MPAAASDAPPPLDGARVARRVLAIVGVGSIVVFGVARAVVSALAPASAPPTTFHPQWIVAAALAWTAALPFQALRWRALLPAPRPPRAGLAWLVTGANLLNIALPGPTGELAAAWVAHRRWGVALGAAVYTSVLARVVALVTLGALVLAGWPFVLGGTGGEARWLEVGAFAVGLGSAGLVVLLLAPTPTARLVVGASRLLPVRLRAPVADRAAWWAENARALAPSTLPPWLAAGGWSTVAALIQGVATAWAFRGMGYAPPPIPLLYTHFLASLASVAALVLPGGLGAMESVYAAVLPSLGGGQQFEAVLGVLAVREAQLGSMVCSLPPLLWLAREAARAPAPAR